MVSTNLLPLRSPGSKDCEGNQEVHVRNVRESHLVSLRHNRSAPRDEQTGRVPREICKSLPRGAGHPDCVLRLGE